MSNLSRVKTKESKNINLSVGQKIKSARLTKAFSQTQLAKAVGVSGSTLSLIESGKYRISLEMLKKIALALNKPLGSFILSENEIVLPRTILSSRAGGVTLNEVVKIAQERQKNNFVYLVITGNIGVGKTALMQLLAKHFNGEAFIENEASNPFLANYYRNMKKYAFQSQLFFITESLKQHIRIEKATRSIIQDRSIHEQCEIFAPTLFELGILKENEFELISQLYKEVRNSFIPPNLVIYLKAKVDTLLQRIKGRGRVYETNIDRGYLEALNKKHDEWINKFKLSKILVVETDDLDIVHIPSHWDIFITRVKDSL